MEETPRRPIEVITEKLELLSGKAMEKHYPGLKEEFDQLRNRRASGELTLEAFYEFLAMHLAARKITSPEQIDRILEERS